MAKVIIKKKSRGLRSLDNDIEDFVEKVGDDMKKNSKNIVPVDTGRLKNSILNVKGNEQFERYIGSGVEYANFVEEGTVNQEAQPYLKPSANKLKEFVNKRRKR